MKQITCSEIGIAGCDFSTSGAAAGDAVEAMVDHIRNEHNIDMPDVEVVMTGNVKEDWLDVVDPAAELAVRRLTEALNIVHAEEPKVQMPAGAWTRST